MVLLVIMNRNLLPKVNSDGDDDDDDDDDVDDDDEDDDDDCVSDNRSNV